MSTTALSPRRVQYPEFYRNSLLITTLFLVCQVTGCNKEGNSVGPSSGGGGKIVVGTAVDVGSSTIGASGGTYTVSKPGSPVDGMQITVPRNSYADGRTFQVSYAPIVSHQLPTGVNLVSPLITFKNGGGYADSVMSVKIPVKIPAGYFAMGFFYDDATGELEGVPLLAHDSSSITLGTRHLSNVAASKAGFLKVFRGSLDPAVRANVVIATIPELELKKNFDTGFRPGVDDWGSPIMARTLHPTGTAMARALELSGISTRRREKEVRRSG
jgi:hypothetical protein